MTYQAAGSFADLAYFPNEAELFRKFKQIIGPIRRYVERLCNIS